MDHIDPQFHINFVRERCRSSGGMILVWHLHSSCAQLVSETVLAEADGASQKMGDPQIARRFLCMIHHV